MLDFTFFNLRIFLFTSDHDAPVVTLEILVIQVAIEIVYGMAVWRFLSVSSFKLKTFKYRIIYVYYKIEKKIQKKRSLMLTAQIHPEDEGILA